MDDANEFFDKMSETVDDDDKINVVVFKDSFTSDLNRTITDIHINNIFIPLNIYKVIKKV